MFCRPKRGAEPMRGYGRVFLLSELQNSELHVIPECGHFVIEKPDAYFSLITAFLRR